MAIHDPSVTTLSAAGDNSPFFALPKVPQGQHLGEENGSCRM
jgi:hypothetical protein